MSERDLINPDGRHERIGDRVSIFQRGGRWYANFQQGAKQVRSSLKTYSKKQARQAAIQLEAKLQDGSYARPRTAVLITAATESYLAYLRTERKAPTTLRKVELVIRRLLEIAVRRRAKSLLDVNLPLVDCYRSEPRCRRRQAQDRAE